MRSLRLLSALALAAALAPAAAHGQRDSLSVFAQTLHENPFAPLLARRVILAATADAVLANNAYTIADVAAIAQIADDFRPSDAFLVGGLIPPNEGLRAGARGLGSVVFTVPTPTIVFGIRAGGHAIMQSRVPDNVARLVRDGFQGDTFSVDLTRMSTSVLEYADVGALAWINLPVNRRLARAHLGLGVRRLVGLGYSRLSFEAGDGSAKPATVRVSGADSVSANVAMLKPVDMKAERGGGGWATDFMFSADVSPRLQLSAIVAGVGRLTVTERPVERRGVTVARGTIGDFLDALDEAPADTLAAAERTVWLPALTRLEASWRGHRNAALGLAYEHRYGPWAVETDAATLVGQLFPNGWFPVTLGVTTGSRYRTSALVGFGINTRALRLLAELTSREPWLPSGAKGTSVKTSVAIGF